MSKIFIGKRKAMEVPQAILIGLASKTKVQVVFDGEMRLEEALDMLHTAEYEVLRTFAEMAIQKHGEAEAKKIKADIYRHSVQGYSLMIDRFYPEAAEATVKS